MAIVIPFSRQACRGFHPRGGQGDNPSLKHIYAMETIMALNIQPVETLCKDDNNLKAGYFCLY